MHGSTQCSVSTLFNGVMVHMTCQHEGHNGDFVSQKHFCLISWSTFSTLVTVYMSHHIDMTFVMVLRTWQSHAMACNAIIEYKATNITQQIIP